MMPEQTEVSVHMVQWVSRAHGLQFHRMRQFKLSNDPTFVFKLRDVLEGNATLSTGTIAGLSGQTGANPPLSDGQWELV
jgi:hypothetical protein